MEIFHLCRDKKKLGNFLAEREQVITEQIPIVREICEDVRQNGDSAVLKYTEKFDGIRLEDPSHLRIKEEEVKTAYEQVDKKFLRAVELARANIEQFHLKQKKGRETWQEKKEGLIIGEKYSPVEKVGVYVPGGKASYPSTVLMNTIPARIAGVGEIILATPNVNPYVLVAADMVGVDKLFRMGGAQAIAAMAFGTKMVPKVYKIVGPGNIYVTMAKFVVQEKAVVGIDTMAGPTEIMIVADGEGKVAYAAADMLAQAEHGMDPLIVLATTSEEFAEAISGEVARQLKKLKKAGIIREALEKNTVIVIVNDIDEAVELANDIAPEHLELHVSRPWECMEKIKNAGAIFIGDSTPESLGDYLAGPNHVLPTGRRAKFSSPLGIDDFLKKTNFVFSDRGQVKRFSDAVIRLAECEGLDAHAEAVRIRLEEQT